MKYLVLVLLALVAVASAKYINLEDVIDLEDITAYGYLSKIGAPLYERIRKAEEEGDMENRIAGGSPASFGQFPYQAGLLARFNGFDGICGGSLVRANRVVTAAHCWFDGQNQAISFIIILGSIRLFSGGTRVTTSNVVMHESWNPILVRNDIAVIKINSNVGISGNIALVALPSGSEDFAGENAIASGFGRTTDAPGLGGPQILNYVTVLVLTNAECSAYFPGFIQSSNICTSGAGGKGTCLGDSGGPLTVNRNGRPLLIGVASFGSARGCQAGYPAVFSRVTSFSRWINSQI